MRTKNAMQLKAFVKNKAQDAGIPAQALMQSFLMERYLERLSRSGWRDKVVIKGGVLISSILGVASRTTMDLDTTIRGFTLTHESAAGVFGGIAAISVDDDWEFTLDRTEDIREGDEYPGIRVHLKASYPPMSIPLTIDVTTGDRVTPGPVAYDYPLLFDEGSIALVAYPLETVLSEKLETVVSRGVANTRPRDFYDIYMLWRLHSSECDLESLHCALVATCEKRDSNARMAQWSEVLDDVERDSLMLAQWAKYSQKNPYAADIRLMDCCESARDLLRLIA